MKIIITFPRVIETLKTISDLQNRPFTTLKRILKIKHFVRAQVSSENKQSSPAVIVYSE